MRGEGIVKNTGKFSPKKKEKKTFINRACQIQFKRPLKGGQLEKGGGDTKILNCLARTRLARRHER